MNKLHTMAWAMLAIGLLAVGADVPATFAQGKADLNKLSMEVNALQMLTNLGLTGDQYKALVKLAKEVSPKATKREAAKGSDKMRGILTDLRLTLAKGEFDKTDKLLAELDTVYEKEKPKLDDFVEISDTGRRRASDVLKMLTARQVADYLTIYPEDLDDPVDLVMATIDEGVKLKGQAWTDLRDSVVEEVCWKLAGTDIIQTKKATERLNFLFDKAHALGAAELMKQRANVEAAFKQTCAVAGPTEQMKNLMEHRLAELLSNPELGTALGTLGKHAKFD
ncbi:MAG: hypothetical protein AB7K24_03945 [Gemmataceae bacterium]